MTANVQQTKLLYWAGIALGPTAWGINTQTIYAMSPFVCGDNGSRFAIAIAAVLAAAAIAGTFIAGRAVRRDVTSEWTDAQGGGQRKYIAWLGVASGVPFALVIVNQLAAAVLIAPCLH